MFLKRTIFIFILSLLILSTFGQLLVPEYFFKDNIGSGESENHFTMQEEIPISVGPPTLDDILPKERDLTTFVELLKKFEDTADIIINPEESHTIFALVNSGFRKLSKKPSQVKDQSEDPNEKLHLFTLGYIVPSVYLTLPNGGELLSLKNKTIKVEKNNNGTFKLNGRANTISRVKAVNGIVYKIDGVLEEEN